MGMREVLECIWVLNKDLTLDADKSNPAFICSKPYVIIIISFMLPITTTLMHKHISFPLNHTCHDYGMS